MKKGLKDNTHLQLCSCWNWILTLSHVVNHILCFKFIVLSRLTTFIPSLHTLHTVIFLFPISSGYIPSFNGSDGREGLFIVHM
jgi:hypothetical protein